MYSLNYVVAFYIGEGRGYNNYNSSFLLDKLCFAKTQINFLNTCSSENIKTATFVFNDDISENLKFRISSELILSNGIKLEIIFRKNGGFSYGIWNDIIISQYKNYDYFFLIEDDYIPITIDFYKPFINRISTNISFVASLVEEANSSIFPFLLESYGSFPFASISNGLLDSRHCDYIFNKYNTIFNINYKNEYSSAWENQVIFFLNFIKEGFSMTDILDEYRSPFVYVRPWGQEQKTFGNITNPALITPIPV